MMHEPTLEDHEAAKAKLAAVQEQWESYSGNNPDKYRSEMRQAREALAAIEVNLKRRGLLLSTENERLYAVLDNAFPNAQSGEIVIFEGVHYRRRFYPATRSNSGKSIRSWVKTWERCARNT